jgi:Fe-S oxidoreductase/nitrate reductase gamma subunit
MLPLEQRIAFLVFALITGTLGLRGFYRVYRRIAAGRKDTEERFDHLPRRIWYALVTTLLQSRTFRKRPWIGFFHSLIFYGFTFYLLVNLVDALEGFVSLPVTMLGPVGNLYIFFADILSALVLVGVVALVIRRYVLPSERDFRFKERTLLHGDVEQRYITRDSLLVSLFILFHVGSRAIGSAAKLATTGPTRFAPFAMLLSPLFNVHNAKAWMIFGYWGALGSVMLFLAYFPYSKHIHIFMAPIKYAVARPATSGVLPSLSLDMDTEEPKLGAANLEDLAWPRLLDAYACIQCNRCQDVCPATATGKALSPSALEVNKRMELNELGRHHPAFEAGAHSPRPLLQFALSPEAAWACTTCGACMQVCPVQDEPMLDIIDIRRNQVMVEGEFPPQLQTAFRGMERANNPWGINHEKRLEWAAGLNVKTTDENPNPDVLFWVGCAASYDPQSQKTARAFVELLDLAGVDFAVLGKRECCTGDSARRAGNEYLYRQLADRNVATLNEVKPKLIVATCPHCLNSVGKEYAQIGGDYQVVHHTEYLESLVADGRLIADSGSSTVTYHDPCYLGRHNGVYDAPRNLLNILSNTVVELDRNRENSFCCGAGGAQFWKEEEPGAERISDNRYREAQRRLEGAVEKVLAVGCPFCKSMLESTPGKGMDIIAVKDVAELLLEGVQRRAGITVSSALPTLMESASIAPTSSPQPEDPSTLVVTEEPPTAAISSLPSQETVGRKKWVAKAPAPKSEQLPVETGTGVSEPSAFVVDDPEPTRKVWSPKRSEHDRAQASVEENPQAGPTDSAPPIRNAWAPKTSAAKPKSSDDPALKQDGSD